MKPAWSLELLKSIEQKRLDFLCAGYFEVLGFRAEITRGMENTDIRLYAANQARPGILTRCRAWSTVPVGIEAVRDLAGLMATEMVYEGAILATGRFSPEAIELARDRGILAIDGEDLLAKLLALPAARRESLLQYAVDNGPPTPTCPSCGMKMLLKEGRQDGKPYWECVKHPLRPLASKVPS